MTKPAEKRKKRETKLLELFQQGGYTLSEVRDELNAFLDEECVSRQTVDGDIRRIKDQLLEKGQELINERGKYKIVLSSGMHNLSNNEKLMVPILENLLSPYSIIPGIERLLAALKKKHIVTNENSVLKNSIVFTSPHLVLVDRVKRAFLGLLDCIFKGEACCFMYSDVHSSGNNLQLVQLFPLQIRENLGRLYLIGLPFGKEEKPSNLKPYAIDCIAMGRIDPLSDLDDNDFEDVTNYTFNYEQLSNKLKLDEYFDGVIGTWHTKEGKKKIERYFAGWALSHVEACPIHSSQKRVTEPKKIKLEHIGGFNELYVAKIQFDVHDTPELSFRFGSYRDYSWHVDYGEAGPKDSQGNPIKLNWEFGTNRLP